MILSLPFFLAFSLASIDSKHIPGKKEATFGQLLDEFKNIEVQRHASLKQILLNPQLMNDNKTSKFLEVATELDLAFMRMRIYCDAALVVFKTINFTQPEDGFIKAAAILKKEKKLDDQIAELTEVYDKMEAAVSGLTEEECDLLHPFILSVAYGQKKLEELSVQFAKDYQKILKNAKTNTKV